MMQTPSCTSGLHVVLLGRPNVGKSTLFNRLTKKGRALVNPTAGTTRDVIEGDLCETGGTLYDLPGLEEHLTSFAKRQTLWPPYALKTLERASHVLLVLDGKQGITPEDQTVVSFVRRMNKPCGVIVNKCDGGKLPALFDEVHSLGLQPFFALSAQDGAGVHELEDWLQEQEHSTEASPEEEDGTASKPIHLALVGRPNVGKSTLLNRLTRQKRALTGPEAGLTRDALAVPWTLAGKPCLLWDTAGLKRRTRRKGAIETLSQDETLRAIRFAQAVVLVMDATQPFEKQDLTIAQTVIDEGRALVVALNKWDQIEDPKKMTLQVTERLDRLLPDIRGALWVPLVSTSGKGEVALKKALAEALKRWSTRITTGALNTFLRDVLAQHQPPAQQGRRPKLRYITQVKSRPPTFCLFGSSLGGLTPAFQRYLLGQMRRVFRLSGVPLRLLLRNADNPYRVKK